MSGVEAMREAMRAYCLAASREAQEGSAEALAASREALAKAQRGAAAIRARQIVMGAAVAWPMLHNKRD